jgi:hypothetical protein
MNKTIIIRIVQVYIEYYLFTDEYCTTLNFPNNFTIDI